MLTFSVELEPDPSGGYIVRVLDYPNVVTQAESAAEAREMAIDAVRTLFWGYIVDGAAIPSPQRVSAAKTKISERIALPALDCAKIELYQLFRASRLRKSQLAQRMGIQRTHVDRLFDLRHASRLGQIEAAFVALGHRLVITAKSAA